MKAPIIAGTLLALLLPLAQAIADTSEKSYYLFLSGKVSAELRGELRPITGFDGKRYQLEDKTVKPSGKLAAGLTPILAVSTMYAEVAEFSFNLHSLESEIRALHTMNEIGAEDLRNQMGLDFEYSTLATDRLSAAATGDTSRLNEIQDQQKDLWDSEDTLEELTYNQTIDQTANLGGLRFMDTVKGQCTLLSEKDIPNVYGALSISLQFVNKEGEINKSAIIRTFPIGDLEAGTPKPVKFESHFPELKVGGAKVDLFLFDGNGKHVATNMARGLKKVSKEELEALRAQSKSEKGA